MQTNGYGPHGPESGGLEEFRRALHEMWAAITAVERDWGRPPEASELNDLCCQRDLSRPEEGVSRALLRVERLHLALIQAGDDRTANLLCRAIDEAKRAYLRDRQNGRAQP